MKYLKMLREIKTPEVETIVEEKNKVKRKGKTVITSVSVSKEFQKLIEAFNISPTDAFRKGMAVELYERGMKDYVNALNEKRIDNIKPILEELDNWTKFIKELNIKKKKIADIDKIINEN